LQFSGSAPRHTDIYLNFPPFPPSIQPHRNLSDKFIELESLDLFMEITESQLSIVLQEALTCFLAFLSHTQKLRESKLPRQGKGIETTADVSSQNYYESRVAATETCLQFTGKIAKSVRRWIKYSTNGSDDEVTAEPEVMSFRASLPDGYEASFLDIFSGSWISPTTPFSAGPSGSSIEDPLGKKSERHSAEVNTYSC
jgi:hypothetical protein